MHRRCRSNDAITSRSADEALGYGDLVDWQELMSGGDGVRLPFHPDLTVPSLTEVRLDVPMPPPVADPESVARAKVVARLAGTVRPGATVAVGAGSRGLSDRVALLRGAIAGLRELGAAQ